MSNYEEIEEQKRRRREMTDEQLEAELPGVFRDKRAGGMADEEIVRCTRSVLRSDFRAEGTH